jgi:hypothetical protein
MQFVLAHALQCIQREIKRWCSGRVFPKASGRTAEVTLACSTRRLRRIRGVRSMDIMHKTEAACVQHFFIPAQRRDSHGFPAANDRPCTRTGVCSNRPSTSSTRAVAYINDTGGQEASRGGVIEAGTVCCSRRNSAMDGWMDAVIKLALHVINAKSRPAALCL